MLASVPRLAAFGLGLLFSITAVETRAQDREGSDDTRARLHFEAGRSHVEIGDYESALGEFQSAYRLSGRKALLYNIGLAHERLGQLSEAVAAYREFVDSGAAGAQESAVRLRIQTLERRLATERPDETPEQGDVEVSAGPETSPSAAPKKQRRGLRIGSIAAFSVAGVALVLGSTFGILTLNEDAKLGGCKETRTCTDDELSSLRTYRVLTDVSFAVSLASAATGLTLWLLSRRGSSDEVSPAAPLSIAPFIGPGHAGLGASGWF